MISWIYLVLVVLLFSGIIFSIASKWSIYPSVHNNRFNFGDVLAVVSFFLLIVKATYDILSHFYKIVPR